MTGAGSDKQAAPDPWDIGFCAALFLLAGLALLVWFPLDIRGGFLEPDHAGKLQPGDAFFPVLLAGAILLLSAFHIISVVLRSSAQNLPATSGRLDRGNVLFLAIFHAIVIAGLAIIYWLGPLVTVTTDIFADGDLTYRQLVDTVPYKYVGYCVGGFLMTAALIAWTEGGLRRRSLLTVLAVIVACVLIFDVLLINVQLPPNADY